MNAPNDPQLESLKVPPHSIEAEQSVLGGLLLDNGAWDRIADFLAQSDFYRYDHRIIFDASVVACRPVGANPPQIVLAYETLSETHWNVPGIEPAFVPELFVDISASMAKKHKALEAYASQINDAPSRSIEACEALAKFRGSQNGCAYAEAFKVVRIVL